MLDNNQMQTVLDLARVFDVGENPSAEALYDGRSAAINLWCTPEDHPAGWEGVSITAGAFCKAAEFVGTLSWAWGEQITLLHLQTEAYALGKRLGRGGIVNRPADIAWARGKVAWLFQEAGIPLPEIAIVQQSWVAADAWLEAGYEDRHGCGLEG